MPIKTNHSHELGEHVRTLARVNSVDLQAGPGPTFWLDWVANAQMATEAAKERLLPGLQVGWIDIFEQAIHTVRYRDSPKSQRPLTYSPSEFDIIEIRERPLIAPLKSVVAIDQDSESSVATVLADGMNEFTVAMLGDYYLERPGKFRTGYPVQTSEVIDVLAQHWSSTQGLDTAVSSAEVFVDPLRRTA